MGKKHRFIEKILKLHVKMLFEQSKNIYSIKILPKKSLKMRKSLKKERTKGENNKKR